MRETEVRSLVEALNFSVCQNPLLHLAPNYGIHWSIYTAKAWGHTFPRGVNVTVDRCLGGLVFLMLARNVRDRGSIPGWDTEFFSLSEPTVTFGTQLPELLIYLYGQSMRIAFPSVAWMSQWTDALVVQYLWHLRRMQETGVRSPVEALNFSVRRNPLSHIFNPCALFSRRKPFRLLNY